MPTICTSSWAPYARHLGELSLDSKRVQSPWPDMHPGDMFKPDIEHLISLYRYTHQKFDKLSESFYDSANDIHREYDWDILTENAFKHLGELNK
jgi:hypothetical protein